MYTPPVYFVVGLSDIGLFDLSVELSDLFVLSDYFVESSMQRFGQNNPISTVYIIWPPVITNKRILTLI